jgi:Glu-tRNA(Gln) amidotransferase subunit E-like FAD-binding protein
MKNKKLHKIAPILSEISLKNNPFKLSENYFESIEDEVSAKIKSQNSKNILSEQVFKVPENYFESLEDVLIAKLKAEALQRNKIEAIPKTYFDAVEDEVLMKIKRNLKVVSLKNRISKYAVPIAIAASLLLLIILKNNDNTITFDSIETSDIEESITDGLIDIDAENVATIFPDIEINDTNLVAALSDDEVLEYLSNEDLDEIIYEN